LLKKEKNTAVGCHFLLQGIFPTRGSNPSVLPWQAGSFPLPRGNPRQVVRRKQFEEMEQGPPTEQAVPPPGFLSPFPSFFPESPSHASVSASLGEGTSRCSKLGNHPQMDKAKEVPPPPKYHLPWAFLLQEYLKPAHRKHASIRKRIHGFSLISSWLGSGLFEDAGVEVGV